MNVFEYKSVLYICGRHESKEYTFYVTSSTELGKEKKETIFYYY